MTPTAALPLLLWGCDPCKTQERPGAIVAERVRSTYAPRIHASVRMNGRRQAPRVDLVGITRIKLAVCKYFGVGATDLLSPNLRGPAVHPRRVAMYLASVDTDSSMHGVGLAFECSHAAARNGAIAVEASPELLAAAGAVRASMFDPA